MSTVAHYQNPMKVYVGVKAKFYSDGRMVPVSFVWEDGMEYEVDRVTEVTQAASLKAGGFEPAIPALCDSSKYIYTSNRIVFLWNGNKKAPWFRP